MSAHELHPRPRSSRLRCAYALCGAIAAGICTLPSRARACEPAPPQWETHPWTATSAPEEDSEPPTRAPVIRGGARPPEAAQGCGKTDEDDLGPDPGDCSTLGSVSIGIEQSAEDDLTPERELAYRIEILEGDQLLPTDIPILPRFDRHGGPGVISTLISQARLRTKLRLIPVDAAGNEGPPSKPIVIEFDETGRCALLSPRPLSSFLPTACILLWAITRRRGVRP